MKSLLCICIIVRTVDIFVSVMITNITSTPVDSYVTRRTARPLTSLGARRTVLMPSVRYAVRGIDHPLAKCAPPLPKLQALHRHLLGEHREQQFPSLLVQWRLLDLVVQRFYSLLQLEIGCFHSTN